MRQILRQAALTFLSFSVLYAAVLAITFLVSPNAPRDGSLNVWDAPSTLYLTSAKYAYLGRDVLNVPDKKVLIMGASNAGLGWRQGEVQALVPCAKVSNLALGGANITEVQEMIDMVHQIQDHAARENNTFVIGVWYGMFVDTERNWPGANRQQGDTDLDIERYRYGFDRRSPTGPVAVLPATWLGVGVTLIRPYLLLEKVARDVTSKLRQTLFARPADLTDAERDTAKISEEGKLEALAYWRQIIGPDEEISQGQVAVLRETIEQLLQSGEKVVLADLPIPNWHRNASVYASSYARSIQSLFDHFAGQRGFTSLRMDDLADDGNFSDEVHVRPRIARIWAMRLARVLNDLICPASFKAASPHVQ